MKSAEGHRKRHLTSSSLDCVCVALHQLQNSDVEGPGALIHGAQIEGHIYKYRETGEDCCTGACGELPLPLLLGVPHQLDQGQDGKQIA